MHITVYCPHCQSRYQLDPALRGKRMRCPNNLCRLVFEVREEREGERRVVSPPVQEPQTDLGVLNEDESPPEGERRPDSPPITEPESEKVWDSKWEPPPIRREGQVVESRHDEGKGRLDEGERRGVSPPVPEPTTTKIHEPAGLRRAARLMIIAMFFVLVGVLGVGIYWVKGKGAANEEERFKKAQELYQNQQFDDATVAFQQLLREFPSGKNRPQYDFLVELSAVRGAVYGPRDQPEERADALKNLLQFLEIYKNDPLLKDYHGDIWHTLQRLAAELTTLAEQQQEMRYLVDAKNAWAEASKFAPPAGSRVDEVAKNLQAEFTRVQALLAARTARLELLETLRDLKSQGTALAVRDGRIRADDAGLASDPEVKALLEELVSAHRAKVVFTPAGTGGLPPHRSPADVDDLTSFYMAPRVGRVYSSEGRITDPAVVLALARGVLYALDAARGDVLWVRRVGVDTNVLPLRVPPSVFMPAMVLVVSSDSQSVSAVTTATGKMIWQHRLKGICLGQPVLVDHHLLIPTLAGEVEEIETAGGTWQGSYSLGQPLVLGGVRQPGTSFVVFPADSYSVYVLDVAKRTCAAILYTGHPPGSLRGLPVIWNEGEGHAGWLLLNQASGSDSLQLRPYALPVRETNEKPVAPDIHVRGDSAAPPWFESGRLALATDAGLMALFGIRQKGNRDPLIFRTLNEDYRLESEERARRGRALIVYAAANDYWVVTGGKLHRMESTITLKSGPALSARWPQPLEVGSPLHAGQIHVGANGQATLIIVTQELDKPTCWVKAVAAEDGQVLWQRQLGMVATDPPVAAADTLLCPDARGVFLFSSNQPPAPDGGWHSPGNFYGNASKATGQWACSRGTGFVHLTWGPEPILRLQIIDKREMVSSHSFPLPALPLGTPALGSDFVLVPLANGIICRVPLGASSIANGPEWRGVGVDETQPGYIVALGNNDFAVTDGGRGLTRFHCGDAKVWDRQGRVELPHRIIAAPAVLGNRLLVADASNTVTLLEGESLLAGQRWSFGGKITAGPFVRGGGTAVVVGKNRLVWLEPGKDQPAWAYDFVAPIVGQPEMVEGLLVVADLQGNILGLDPTTGNPVGPGYRLKANEAPTTAPIAFGQGQVFMPLMDGTAVVLPLSKLR
jgi:tetratricopeptide (TPR) repeat protein